MLVGTEWLGDGKLPAAVGCGGWCCRCSGVAAWMYFDAAAWRPSRLKRRNRTVMSIK